MDFIFNSVADVAVFVGLVLLCFCDVLSSAVFQAQWAESDWYKRTAKRVTGLPPWWLFPVAWTVLYVLIITSLYMLYRQVNQSGLFGEAIDAITLLAVGNLVLNKLWSPVFFQLQQPLAAFAICVAIEASAIGVLVFMWLNNYTTQFWIYLPYPIWCLYALYLNAAWLWVRRSSRSATTC